MDRIITLFCSFGGKVGNEMGVISIVGELVGITGEGLVYCTQPTKAKPENSVIRNRLSAAPI
jgi:hypothetical protein